MGLDSPVLFSCKITHSVISYLDRRGEDLGLLYEKCDWPMEFLRDPSSWLEADKMENLLRLIEGDFGGRGGQREAPKRRMDGSVDAIEENLEDGLIANAGRQCKDLRSWGVLDSVLRMVQTPKDLFAQPERFLSYFISPAPPIGELKRAADSVSFVLPVSEMQFPFVTAYLRSALEALPSYINKPMASVRWKESRVQISWSERQVSLFNEAQNTELSLHPELVRNILMNLESSQRELEETKRALLSKDQEIEKLKAALEIERPAAPYLASLAVPAAPLIADLSAEHATAPLKAVSAVPAFDLNGLARGVEQELSPQVATILSELYRAGDYMARGCQLVTLLVGQGRSTPQVQEAMRRVDWPYVVQEGPRIIKRAIERLQVMQDTVGNIGDLAQNQNIHQAEEIRVLSDLNALVSRAVETVKASVEMYSLARFAHLRKPLPGTSAAPDSKALNSSAAAVNTAAHESIHIDQHLLLDREVKLMPKRIELALANLLSASVESLQPGGIVRVVTRPHGANAQIEITDNGRGWDEGTLRWLMSPHDFSRPMSHLASDHSSPESRSLHQPAPRLSLALAQSIIRLHDGSMVVTSQPGQGSTVLIDLPLI
jgi:signal transduction histidine kinase